MTITDDWSSFETRLAASLAALQEHHYLILSDPWTHYFLQFAAGGRWGLRAEAVSNHYATPRRQLGPLFDPGANAG